VRTKPAPEVSAGASAGGASGAAAGARKLDAFTRMFKDTVVDLINTDLSQPLPEGAGTPRHATPGQQPSSQPPSKQSPKPRTALQHPQQQSQQQPQQQDAARPSSSSGQGAGAGAAVPTGPAQPATSAPPATGLRQRVVAIASLSVLADALRAARALLQQRLGGVGLSKEVEAFFSRTVDAAADLQDAIYMGGAKQLMPVSGGAGWRVPWPPRGSCVPQLPCAALPLRRAGACRQGGRRGRRHRGMQLRHARARNALPAMGGGCGGRVWRLQRCAHRVPAATGRAAQGESCTLQLAARVLTCTHWQRGPCARVWRHGSVRA
jgi:hypothetical protein